MQNTLTSIAREELQPGLTNFDLLPNSAHVREPVVKALFACSSTTVWRYVRHGLIPKPYKLGRITYWNVGELRSVLISGSRK